MSQKLPLWQRLYGHEHLYELARLIGAWPRLTPHIKAAVLALLRASE